MDIAESIIPRSDQVNADDLIAGPRTVTIADVVRGTPEQPVNIVTTEFGPERPYKPSKSMRRILVAAWGTEASNYVGRRITIYRDPDITFGKDKVGGIRISHLSHLKRRLEVALTVTRGKRATFTVDPLPDEPVDDFVERIDAATTLEALDAIARDLKARDLGSRRSALLEHWSRRKSQLQAAEAPDADRSDELLEMEAE